MALHRYEEAIRMAEKEIALRKEIRQAEIELEGPYRNVARALEALGRYEEALDYYRLRLELLIKDEEDFDEEEAFCREDIADVLGMLGQYEASISEYEDALGYYETMRENDIFEYVVFIRFDVSSIPPQSVISSAVLRLYYYRWGDNDPAGGYLSLYRVTDVWNPEAMTYNRQPSTALWPTSVSAIPPEFGWMEWDVTADVQDFVSGDAENYGWRLVDEDYWGRIDIPSVQFYAKNCYHDRPHLEIELAFNDRGPSSLPAPSVVLYATDNAHVGRADPETPGPSGLTMMVRNRYGSPVREIQMGRCYRGIGKALQELGRHEEAIEYQWRALEIFRNVPGEDRNRAEIHRTIGLMLDGFGEYQECIENQKISLDLYEKVRDPGKERAICHLYIGNSLRELERYRESIAHYERGLALCRDIEGTEPTQAECYYQMAITYYRLGDYKRSIENYRKALEIYRKMSGAKWQQGVSHWSMGDVLMSSGRFEEAIAHQEEALTLFGVLEGRTRDRALSHTRLARSYLQRGRRPDLESASRHTAEALRLAERCRDLALGMDARIGIFENVASVYSNAVAFLMSCGDADWFPEDTLFRRWSSSSRPRIGCLEAAFHFAEACKARTLMDLTLQRMPEVRDSTSLKLLKADARLGDEIRSLHSRLMALDACEEEAAERIRRRLREKEIERAQIEFKLKSTLIGRYRTPPFTTAAEVRKQLDGETAVLEYIVGQDEIVLLVLTDSAIRGWRTPIDCDMPEGMWTGRDSRPERLERAFWKDQSSIGLTGLVRLYRNWMEHIPTGEEDYRVDLETHIKAGRFLHDLLLPEGARETLKNEGISHLIVVPDHTLHLLPFDALIAGSKDGDEPRSFSECRYLIHDYAVSLAPSVALLDVMRRQKEERGREPIKGFLGLGDGIYEEEDPRLTRSVGALKGEESWSFWASHCVQLRGGYERIPKTQEEVMKIAALFPDTAVYRVPPYESLFEEHSSVLLGSAACRDALELAPLEDYRYIHFAAHAQADERNPWLSCIVLSGGWEEGEYQPYFLRALDIFGVELSAELVTLSACETGLGRQVSGEGMVGLVTPFLHAGASSVAVSLWPVASGETGELMERFYTHLSEGEDRATALRAAKLEMIDQETADPSFWAAFVLHGLAD